VAGETAADIAVEGRETAAGIAGGPTVATEEILLGSKGEQPDIVPKASEADDMPAPGGVVGNMVNAPTGGGGGPGTEVICGPHIDPR